MQVNLRKPGIQILLKKNVGRATVAGSVPLSSRYAGTNGVIDLTPYLGEHGAVRVTKSVRSFTGAFSIVLPDQIFPDILDSIAYLIEPMDTIEIYMAGDAYQYVGAGLPIMMRGFVSRVQRQRGMSPDGKPTRSVVISGQDYGKVLQICQTFNLPYGPTVAVALSSFPFFARYGFSSTAMTVQSFLQTVIDKIINPYISQMRENADGSTNTQSPLLPLTLDCQNLGDQVAPYGVGGWNEGTMESLIGQFTDIGAWNECFVEDRVDGPYLVFRPNPYKDASTGKFVFNDVKSPSIIKIDDSHIVTMSQERSDENVANYYWVECPRFLNNFESTARATAFQSAQAAELGGVGGTVFVDSYGNCNPTLYGLRKMEEQTQMAGGDELYNGMGLNGLALPQAKSAALDWITAQREALIAQNKDNVVFENGSMHLKGNELIKPGVYVQVSEGISANGDAPLASEYYASEVTHDYQPFGNYFTTVQFVRGTGFINRAQQADTPFSPYYAEMGRNVA